MKLTDEQLRREWAEADEVSDKMIEMLNARLAMVEVDQLLVGVLLGLLGFLKTMPTNIPWPVSLLALESSANVVVEELVNIRPMSGRSRSKNES